MLILLIDTAHPQARLVLTKDKQIIEDKQWPNDKYVGSALLKGIDAMLKKHSISLKDVKRIAVHVGPGGYSSLRAGATVAQMISFATGAELVAVTGFDVEVMIEEALAGQPVKALKLEYATSGIG